MKKRSMKKYIPRNTDYCYKRNGTNVECCKNRMYLGVRTYKGVFEGKHWKEEIPTYKCRYTGILNVDDPCFADMCKCCEVGHPDF